MAQKISDGHKSIELANGSVIEVHAIPLNLLEAFDKNHVPPTPPIVTVEAIGGVFEDEPNLDDDDYLEAFDRFNMKTWDDLVNLVILHGVRVEIPVDGEWRLSLELCGIVLPEPGSLLEKLEYMKKYLMRDTIEDFKRMTSAALSMSGVSEEAIQSWEGLF